MQLTTYPSAVGFLAHTRDVLQQDEVANNLMLGVALRLAAAPEEIKSPPYLATVEHDGVLILAALMTPPYPLTLFRTEQVETALKPACDLLIHDLLSHGWPVSHVSGRKPLPEEFARVWTELTGSASHISMRERIYELRQVIPARPVPGDLRQATVEDVDIVAQWAVEFFAEALPDESQADARESALRRLKLGEIVLWEVDGRPVSMASKSRPMQTSISVNLVYTPPAWRRRGYAGACVAALSQRLLDEGWQSCALFTDLANPTSNSIYQKIGYQPVCDFDVVAFDSYAT